jgi:protein-tyrosine phosphatase
VSLFRSSPPHFTVLLVCTGNICRSALAERLGRAYLTEVLDGDADRIRLVSAGTQAVMGSDMHPDSALVLRGFGAEPGDFQARQLQPAHTATADLVLTMTRAHRRAVLELAPRMLSRTFTLLEAADLLSRLPTDESSQAGDFLERADALVQKLAAARSQRPGSAADDVPDPIGRPVDEHQLAGDAIVGALLPVLSRFAALAVDAPFRTSAPLTDEASVA